MHPPPPPALPICINHELHPLCQSHQESSLYRLKILYKGNSQDFYHNMFIDLQTEEKSLYPPLSRKWLTPQPLGQIT